MENIYRSPDEAYPFLADEPQDLRCDFELLTLPEAARSKTDESITLFTPGDNRKRFYALPGVFLFTKKNA